MIGSHELDAPDAVQSSMTADALPRRPLLVGLYHVVTLGPDRVAVANAGRQVVLAGEGLAERLSPLLAALDGRSTLDDLGRRFGDLVPSVLDALFAKGLLTEADEDSERATASAATAAATVTPGLSPAEVGTRLGAATVAVSGCGPVGAAVALLLTRAGVGGLIMADDGIVSDRDVVMSPVLPSHRVGDRLAMASAELCRRAGARSVEVQGRPLSADLIPRLDVAVIEAGFDETPTTEADRCLAAGLPYLVHAQDGLEAVVGPLVSRGGQPCHRCLEIRRLSHLDRLGEHLAYRDQRAATAPRSDAFLAAHCSIVAGVVATEALRALLAPDAPFRAAAMVIDLPRLGFSREEILPVPGCPGCHTAAGTDDHSDVLP